MWQLMPVVRKSFWKGTSGTGVSFGPSESHRELAVRGFLMIFDQFDEFSMLEVAHNSSAFESVCSSTNLGPLNAPLGLNSTASAEMTAPANWSLLSQISCLS